MSVLEREGLVKLVARTITLVWLVAACAGAHGAPYRHTELVSVDR